MAVMLFCPAAAAMGEVLAMSDQPRVQMAGEQRDAVGAEVVPEEVAGHAELAAAAGAEHVLVKPGPASIASRREGCRREWGNSTQLMVPPAALPKR